MTAVPGSAFHAWRFSQAQGATTATGAVPRSLPASSLSVREGTVWRTWWRSERAPRAWGDEATLARAVTWRVLAPGLRWGQAELAGNGEAWRTSLIVVQVDPRRTRVALDTAFTSGLRRAWTIDRVPASARIAMNAGQFVAELPWGWVVLDGRQYLAPGHGPLASAVAIDSSGAVRWQHGGGLPARGGIQWAFQSYPTLLDAGRVPLSLQIDDGGIDVAHRDARLAIGTRADGSLLIAMSRFGALGTTLGFVPFGLTTPEMAAVMGALGARESVMLDGGISAQLLIRGPGDRVARFAGVRRVPLGLLIFADTVGRKSLTH